MVVVVEVLTMVVVVVLVVLLVVLPAMAELHYCRRQTIAPG